MQATIAIVNPQNGRMTDYTFAQLRKDAAHAVKGKGRLEHFWVEFVEGGNATLVAQYQESSGWCASMRIAI